MRCYYVYDAVSGQKILIHGCWGTVHSDDIEDCICKPDTYHQFEKEKYNEVLKEKVKEIEELYKEVKRLNSRVKYWHKKFKSKEK